MNFCRFIYNVFCGTNTTQLRINELRENLPKYHYPILDVNENTLNNLPILSKEPMSESLLWFLLTGEVPTSVEALLFKDELNKRSNLSEDIINLMSDDNNNLSYSDKTKNFKKCNKLIASCQEKVEEYENIIENNNFSEIKCTHLLQVITTELENNDNKIPIETLIEYLGSIKKIKKSLT